MSACPFCGTQNPDTASVCSLCKRSLRRHKNRWKRWGILIAMSVLLVVTLFAMEHFSRQAETLKMAQQKKAAIEILSSYGYRTQSAFMVVEGKVRNVSGQALEGVYVVVSWHSKDNKLVARKRDAVYNDPFMNYQTTGFGVKIPHNPDMNKYDLSFETEDGTVLLAADNRKAIEDLTFSEQNK